MATTDRTTDDARTTQSEHTKAADRHLALVVTFVTTALFVAKILVAARFELTTALGIVSATSSTSLLLGLAVASVPAVAAVATGYLMAEVSARWVRRRPLHVPLLGLVAALAALGAFASWPLLAFVLLWALIEFFRARSERPLVDQGEASSAAALLARARTPIYVVALVCGALVILSPDPWPVEALVTDDGTTTGFVLQSDHTWWTVLSYGDRSLVYIPSEDVTGRFLCRPERSSGSVSATIPELLLEQPDLPPCGAPQ